MSQKPICIMLVDDNRLDNFIHERAIKKNNINNVVVATTSGSEALDYLISNIDPNADLILLDINMPTMNGWEFLEAYKHLENVLRKHIVVIMLSTSDNPDEIAKAKSLSFVTDYITKPLTPSKMDDISAKYFAN